MTEQEWLTSEDAAAMLNRLRGLRGDGTSAPYVGGLLPDDWHHGKCLVSDRKLRLFVCACCRAVRGKDSEGWRRFLLAVDQLELAADIDPYASSALIDTYFHPDWDVSTLAQWAARDLPSAPDILREIIGNPYRPIELSPSWRTPTVLSLAHAAYDERILPSGELDPARLAILSDALEEARCDDEAILLHLRSPGPHYRGMWSLDLVLGKE